MVHPSDVHIIPELAAGPQPSDWLPPTVHLNLWVFHNVKLRTFGSLGAGGLKTCGSLQMSDGTTVAKVPIELANFLGWMVQQVCNEAGY